MANHRDRVLDAPRRRQAASATAEFAGGRRRIAEHAANRRLMFADHRRSRRRACCRAWEDSAFSPGGTASAWPSEVRLGRCPVLGQSSMAKKQSDPCQSHQNVPNCDFHQTVLHNIPCELFAHHCRCQRKSLRLRLLAGKFAGLGAFRCSFHTVRGCQQLPNRPVPARRIQIIVKIFLKATNYVIGKIYLIVKSIANYLSSLAPCGLESLWDFPARQLVNARAPARQVMNLIEFSLLRPARADFLDALSKLP